MEYLLNIKKMYIITFFHALIPAYVIERLFWEQRGMNIQMVVYCEIIYALTVIFLEIPSGIFSDRFGRKRLLIVSAALTTVEFLLLIFAHGFLMFALVVFLSGVGKALSSGTQNALLYDSLLAAKKSSSFEKIIGRVNGIDFVSSALAALSGGLMAKFYPFELNYWIAFVSTTIAFVVMFTLKEPPAVTKIESEFADLRGHLRIALNFFKSHRLILYYCLTGAFMGACINYLDEFWQILMQLIGIPIALFGIIGAFGLVLRVPGNMMAHRINNRFTYDQIFVTVILLTAAGFISIFLLRNIFCLIPVVGVAFISGTVEPIIAGCLHHNVESSYRATVESCLSLGMRAITVAVGLIFAYISTKYSIFAGFGILGLLCAIYLLWFVYAEKKQIGH